MHYQDFGAIGSLGLFNKHMQITKSVIYTLSDELISMGTFELKLSLSEAPLRANKGHQNHWPLSSLLIAN